MNSLKFCDSQRKRKNENILNPMRTLSPTIPLGQPTKKEIQAFAEEIHLLHSIGSHPNILNMLACVTKERPLRLVLEFMSEGNLKGYLQRICKQVWLIQLEV